MELALFVYFAGIVENIGGFLLAISLISGFVLAFYYLYNALDETFNETKKWLICIPLICGLVTSMIPSEKTMYLMLAGYTTQQVVQSETGDKVVKVINAKLDEYLEDMSKVKKDKK